MNCRSSQLAVLNLNSTLPRVKSNPLPDTKARAPQIMAVDNNEDIEAPDATDPVLNTVDFGLQIGVEELLVDVDPDVSLEFLKKAEAHAGKPPPTRVPKETILRMHNHYVEQQQNAGQEKAPRMVKKVVLALSYPPSSKAIKYLSPASQPECEPFGTKFLTARRCGWTSCWSRTITRTGIWW